MYFIYFICENCFCIVYMSVHVFICVYACVCMCGCEYEQIGTNLD